MEPIPLTEAQISEIISEVPQVRGIGKTAVLIATQELIRQCIDVLKQIKLIPKKEAFQEFKKEFIYSAYSSQIETGRPVGPAAAVGLTQPVTQATLKMVHFAGSKSSSTSSFSEMKGLLTGTKTIKTPQMNIFFIEPYTKLGENPDLHNLIHNQTAESILLKKADFEQTTVKDITLDAEIILQQQAINEGIPRLIQIHSFIRPQRKFDMIYRHKLNAVLKLTLDPYRMYTHKITMSMVAQSIEGPAPPDSLSCVWRSQNDGILYILIDETGDYSKNIVTPEASLRTHLDIFVKRRLNENIIKGIPGIINIDPVEVVVLNGVYKTEFIKNGEQYQYQVFTDNHRTRWLGISLADLKKLFEAAGFIVGPITNANKQNLYIDILSYKDSYFTSKKLDLEQIVLDRINAAKEEDTPEAKMLVNASTFYYGKTIGSNIHYLAWREDIDHFRTIDNNSHDIAQSEGIDAARLYLIWKLRAIIIESGEGKGINGRHISIIFDMITNLGIVNSLNFAGINRRKDSVIASASNERAAGVIINSATFGSKESMNNVSAAMSIGKMPGNIGTATVGILEDKFEKETSLPLHPNVSQNLAVSDEEVVTGSFLAGTTVESVLDLLETEAKKRTMNTNRIITPPKTAKILPAPTTIPSISSSQTTQIEVNKEIANEIADKVALVNEIGNLSTQPPAALVKAIEKSNFIDDKPIIRETIIPQKVEVPVFTQTVLPTIPSIPSITTNQSAISDLVSLFPTQEELVKQPQKATVPLASISAFMSSVKK